MKNKSLDITDDLITSKESYVKNVIIDELGPDDDRPGSTRFNIEGEILLGSNSCYADGYVAKFVVKKDQSGKLVVMPTIRKAKIAANESDMIVCSADYNPVFEKQMIGYTAKSLRSISVANRY